MDAYEGIAKDPRSLHKYLYTGANPVDRIDPSGNSFMDSLIAFSVQAILTTISVLQSPGVQLAFAILNVYAFVRDPEYAHAFFASGGNPYELAAILAADFRTLAGGARVASSQIRQATVTLNYNRGSVPDFWYKTNALSERAESGGLFVVEGTDAIRSESAQKTYRRAAVKTYAKQLQSNFGMDVETSAKVAEDHFRNFDVDHKIDLQVSGGLMDPNDPFNLGMLDPSVNRSIGRQLQDEINRQGLKQGDVITKIIINGPPGP
jgi:hypothetical protein